MAGQTDIGAYEHQITVTGISPAVGTPAGGTQVTITGAGFTGATAVYFGSTKATSVTVVSDTRITATSPAGTGVVDVTVVTAGGTSATSSADQFSYVPVVTAISPAVGTPAGGTQVTITGAGFTGATAVNFGGTKATSVTVVSDTQITATSPAGTGVADVTVTTATGTSATSSADQFTYAPVPAVTSLSPSAGSAAGGTSVTITGTGLANASAVKFGSTPATIVSDTATQLVVTSPAGAAGTVDVTVVTTGGTSVVSTADQYTYVTAPAVTGVSPASAPATGGTTVTIMGTNMTNGWAVYFGTTLTTIVSDTNTQIVVTSPPGVAGTVDVTVVTTGGTSATSSADQFTYVAVPTVTGISPTVGPAAGGTTVTITGTGLANAWAVMFGSAPATIISDSDTQLVVTSPANPAGSVAGTVGVTVVTAGGTSTISAADQFTYAPVPALTSLSPSVGPAAGGTTVMITGTGLANVMAVKFGSVTATIVSDSATQLVVTSPAGSAGVVDVTVMTLGGMSAVSAADQFTYAQGPTVTYVSPSTGPATGGTMVTITGTNLANAWAVYFGTSMATIVSNSNTQLVVASPANPAGNAAGAADVTVVTVGGVSAASSADLFSYVQTPTVTSISPSFGPAVGGTTVSIVGAGFANASAILFGTRAATIISDSNTLLVVTNPAGVAGAVDVTVVTAGGTSVTSAADQFTYAPVPAVTSLSPSVGPAAGGTTVMITGTGFTAATAVDFGIVAATSFVVVSDTQITATSPAGTGAVYVTVTGPGGTSTTSSADAFTYVVPTVSLTWSGPGSALNLVENTPGATPTITISEPSPNESLLKIDLGAGEAFASGSTVAATGLTYENPGSPTTSQYATIDISEANNVSSLQATLPGDDLTLGQINDSDAGIGGIVASAGDHRGCGHRHLRRQRQRGPESGRQPHGGRRGHH